MTILVDMDDVLEQLLDGMIRYINSRYGTKTTLDDIREWELASAFPGLSREQIYSPELDPDFWKDVKPMPGANEALQKLIADGHEIYIVTASLYQTLPEKMDEVLFRYFPYISWDHVIVTHNKHLIHGDVLVDDGPHNLTGGSYRKILFEAPHNRNFDESSIGAKRARTWEEVYELISAMSETA